MSCKAIADFRVKIVLEPVTKQDIVDEPAVKRRDNTLEAAKSIKYTETIEH